MAICILLVCFLAIFLNLGVWLDGKNSKRDLLIYSVLTFCVITVFITELLSVFSAIAYYSILLSWGIVFGINIVLLYIKHADAGIFVAALKQRVLSICRSLTGGEKFWLSSTLVILLLVFAQGIIYPPNNWDSMTYHLSRITAWISRGSVGHFPTNIFYQVYQGPFAEYVIMHFNMLARNDYFSATVQFCFLLFMLVTLTNVIKTLGLQRRYQILAVIFATLIPEVLLQASSTQNNIVESFFVLTAYYFTLKSIKGTAFNDYFFLGMAVGLALLTKSTAYIYLFPILLVFAIRVLNRFFKTRNLKYIWYPIMVILIGLAINYRQYQRNYNLDKNILGAPASEVGIYTNTRMNPLLLLSNVIKNAGLQMSMMGITAPAIISDTIIHKLHATAGLDINSPDNNFGHSIYQVPTGGANHEDGAPNPFHFLLVVVAFGIICYNAFKSKQNILVLQLLLIVLAQVLFFCWYLKWQPWNTRMHVQFFMLSVPLFCYAVSTSAPFSKIVYMVAMPVILLYGIVLVLHNSSRPYLLLNKQRPYLTTTVFDARYKKYFDNKPGMYPEYQKISQSIQAAGYKNIGLILGSIDWQYPLFNNCYSRELNPVHLFVKNVTKNVNDIFTSVDCIVSTTVNRPFIDYNGKRFYNTDCKSQYICLYK